MKEKIKNIRLPPIPSDISENIIKYILHKNGEFSSWGCKSGDLYLKGKQECKCFTSDGPISFSPNSNWNAIYFLDARDWLNDNFKLFTFKKTSNEWKNIKVNKKETMEDQCKQKRRPRINWFKLEKECELIFSGTFDEIIN